ncbi:MAG: AAA family ATPase [Quisquiliibacterium sp.]
MYAQHFGLDREPFSIAPDPHYLFMSERHREALAHLLYGVSAGGGFVLLTGAIGAGKTTICRSFLEQIPNGCRVAYIFNPKLTVHELLGSICAEFGAQPQVPATREPTLKDYVDALNAALLATHAQGGSSVLIIDEAQSLAPDVLEQLRLLTNLETNERKLLQVVLIGQPELREMLAAPEMQQLSQRVIARYHLDALQAQETALYIRHRMTVAGLRGPLPFDPRALSRIHRLAHGVPRRINLLCDRALLGAYARGEAQVGVAAVKDAASEVLAEPTGTGTAPPMLIRGLILLVAVTLGALGAALMLRNQATDPGTKHSALASTQPSPKTASTAKPGPSPQAAPSAPTPRTDPGQVSMAPAGSATRSALVPSGGATPSAPPASPEPEAFELPTGFASLVRPEDDAMRELALAWSAQVGAGDPCIWLAAAQLQCYRNRQATLALIRQLDRPGILTLRDAQGRIAPVLLAGLDAREALLSIDGRLRRVSLVALADYWRGEFATLWRVAPARDAGDDPASGNPSPRWLAARLSQADGRVFANPQAPDAEQLRVRIHTFQLAHGLPSDGIAGPITLMQLNRATGVDEPRLRAPAPPASR